MTESTTQKIKLIRCLYNKGYGEINVSQECRDKYKEFHKEELIEDILFCRADTKLIKVVDIIGLEKASNGKSCCLGYELIPQELEEYINIDFYGEQETIYINYNQAYANVLHEIMERNIRVQYKDVLQYGISNWDCNCISEKLVNKYKRITYIKNKMNELVENNIDTTLFQLV